MNASFIFFQHMFLCHSSTIYTNKHLYFFFIYFRSSVIVRHTPPKLWRYMYHGEDRVGGERALTFISIPVPLYLSNSMETREHRSLLSKYKIRLEDIVRSEVWGGILCLLLRCLTFPAKAMDGSVLLGSLHASQRASSLAPSLPLDQ